MQLIMETNAAKQCRDTNNEQCITNILAVQVLSHMFGTFLGPGHYRFVAGTCRAFADAYGRVMPKQDGQKTTWDSAAASVSCAKLCLSETNAVVGIALAAAQNGQIDVVHLSYNNGFHCCWEQYLFSEAARFGQIKVFQYGLDHNLTWDNSGVAASAAKSGQVNVLEWMQCHGAENLNFRDCAQEGARSGQVTVLEWLQKKGIPLEDIESCFCNAANYGHINVLDWLLNHGFCLSRSLMDSAARFGHIKLMKIALKRGNEMTTKTCAIAAFYGKLNALQWLRTNGCQWDNNVIHWAEENDNWEVLDWARTNDCPSTCERMYSFMELYHL